MMSRYPILYGGYEEDDRIPCRKCGMRYRWLRAFPDNCGGWYAECAKCRDGRKKLAVKMGIIALEVGHDTEFGKKVLKDLGYEDD